MYIQCILIIVIAIAFSCFLLLPIVPFLCPQSAPFHFLLLFFPPMSFISIAYRNMVKGYSLYHLLSPWRKGLSLHHRLTIDSVEVVRICVSLPLLTRFVLEPILDRSCVGNYSCIEFRMHQACRTQKPVSHISPSLSMALTSPHLLWEPWVLEGVIEMCNFQMSTQQLLFLIISAITSPCRYHWPAKGSFYGPNWQH